MSSAVRLIPSSSHQELLPAQRIRIILHVCRRDNKHHIEKGQAFQYDANHIEKGQAFV